jgi:hypothetical protein
LEHPKGVPPHLDEVAGGNINHQCSDLEGEPSVKTRIDVKTTEGKISPDTVKKFAGDVRRDPDRVGHVLMGGRVLSPKANFDLKKLNKLKKKLEKQ